MPTRYDPMQYSLARVKNTTNTIQGIMSSVTDLATKIPEIAKTRRINEKIEGAYNQIFSDFKAELKRVDPDKYSDEGAAAIAFRRFINPNIVLSKDIPAETRLSTMLKMAGPAQKFVDNLEAETTSKSFMNKARKPITETKTVQAEGPPIQGERAAGPPIQTGARAGEVPMLEGPRTGEVPMERQTTSTPMSYQKYQQGLYDLSPQAREMVPETLGKQVQEAEAVFQNPMKTYEADRDKRLKERKDNISTMTATDKGAGIKTAIIESNSEVMNLKSKQKTLGDLIKLVNKSENMTNKEMDLGKQMDAKVEIESIAGQLRIPEQLSKDKDFLGRMDDQIDRLIEKEQNQQKEWDAMYNELRKREAEEARNKGRPKPPSVGSLTNIDFKLQDAVDQKLKQSFPDLYNVVPGEYGIETMKKLNGIAEAGRRISEDPVKRAALAYHYGLGRAAQLAGQPKPSQQEIDSVIQEISELQNRVYGVIQGGAEAPTRGSGF